MIEYVLLSILILFLLYIIIRILAKGVFRSYFEIKKEFIKKGDLKNE